MPTFGKEAIHRLIQHGKVGMLRPQLETNLDRWQFQESLSRKKRAVMVFRAQSFLVGIAVLFTSNWCIAADPIRLPRSTPEAQGMSSERIREFIEAANSKVDTLHSVIIVRHGSVVAEGWWKPEAPDKKHVLHSLSKSFTSTAVGFAVAEGKLSIDDPVLKFFPDEAPAEQSSNLKGMRVRDLLTMSTGHQAECKFTAETPWVTTFLAHPVPHKPGTHFQYNSPATYMCSAVVQKVTGQTVLDYLKPRLFEPLGIENPEWGTSPQGITVGGWGLHIRTEDIAKFGQLYLQKGKWNGKQLILESWINEATGRQVSTGSDPDRDWDQGYGFQFWRCRHGAFRGDGAFGQFCVVLPQQDTVIAITADTKDMQAELNVVWDKLLSAFQSESLPANPDAVAKLKQALDGLTVPEGHVANVIKLPGT
jgi:CubicO group peptidase (beta-lactamase class C family)